MLILTLIVSTTAILFLTYLLHESRKGYQEALKECANLEGVIEKELQERHITEVRLNKWLQEKHTTSVRLKQEYLVQKTNIKFLEDSLVYAREEYREVKRQLVSLQRNQ